VRRPPGLFDTAVIASGTLRAYSRKRHEHQRGRKQSGKERRMGIGFIGAIIVGGLAGWIASMIMSANTGILLNIVLGIVGAVVLNAILSMVGIYAANAWIPQLIVGLVGACLLIWGWRAISR